MTSCHLATSQPSMLIEFKNIAVFSTNSTHFLTPEKPSRVTLSKVTPLVS